QRPRDAGAKEILIFVDRSSLNHREDEIAREFFLKVVNIDFGCTGPSGFLIEILEFLFLADIGAKGDHLRLIFLFDPGKQDRSIESARISQNDFHIGRLTAKNAATPSGKCARGFPEIADRVRSQSQKIFAVQNASDRKTSATACDYLLVLVCSQGAS